MKKFKITKGNRVYIVDAKSHIDAISKVKTVKTDEVRDSISQWKPGMSEIGLFQISYKKGTVYQSILVKAATKEDAINKFTKHKPDAEVIGVNEYPNPHFGEPILDSSIKDINQVLLSNLKQVAQKGDAWWNKWKKLLDMSDKWNFYQWKELRNNDPKKYELIIRNKQYAEKEAEALNREWDRAIDALSRDRSFGRPGDYRMDLHSYKSRNDNYPMGNSQRYDEILYGYEQAEKSAREKKGLDSSIKDGSYGTVTMTINSLDDINLTNLVKYIRNQFTQKWDKKIKEIITADVSNAYDSAKLSLSFKEKDDDSWTFSTVTLNVRPSTSLIEKYYKDNGTYAEKKLIADIVKKLKQYSNKTIYKNNTITDGSAIKDAYIEEWWGQTSENPNTVARRYGVSVKQLKRNNDQILYRFEGDINKLNRMHSDGYFMSIDMDGNSIKDGNNQLSAPKNLRVGSRIQTRNGTYTIIAIDNNDIATIQYENDR